jgi:hypothetical protein
VLELGTVGSHGHSKDEAPVLRDGAVVAVLRASNWREAATAVVEDRECVFGKQKGQLIARWAADPPDVVRMRAAQTSLWKGTWIVDLEGTPMEVTNLSIWKRTRRYVSGARVVGESGSTGGWSPRPTLSVDDSIGLHHQVFLLWMELVLNRRNTAAIGAATTAAVIGGSS